MVGRLVGCIRGQSCAPQDRGSTGRVAHGLHPTDWPRHVRPAGGWRANETQESSRRPRLNLGLVRPPDATAIGYSQPAARRSNEPPFMRSSARGPWDQWKNRSLPGRFAVMSDRVRCNGHERAASGTRKGAPRQADSDELPPMKSSLLVQKQQSRYAIPRLRRGRADTVWGSFNCWTPRLSASGSDVSCPNLRWPLDAISPTLLTHIADSRPRQGWSRI